MTWLKKLAIGVFVLGFIYFNWPSKPNEPSEPSPTPQVSSEWQHIIQLQQNISEGSRLATACDKAGPRSRACKKHEKHLDRMREISRRQQALIGMLGGMNAANQIGNSVQGSHRRLLDRNAASVGVINDLW
jgi:hypothetical protein